MLTAMGGWMTYQRLRTRNGLNFRKPDHDPDPYWRGGIRGHDVNWEGLCGDLNRMERDYLDPDYPRLPFATRPDESSPAEECATATGIPVDTVRRILRYVFLEQR